MGDEKFKNWSEVGSTFGLSPETAQKWATRFGPNSAAAQAAGPASAASLPDAPPPGLPASSGPQIGPKSLMGNGFSRPPLASFASSEDAPVSSGGYGPAGGATGKRVEAAHQETQAGIRRANLADASFYDPNGGTPAGQMSGGGGPVVVIPGKRQGAEWKVQEGYKTPEAVTNDQIDARSQTLRTGEMEAQQAVTKANEDAVYASAMSQASATLAEQQRARELDRQAAYQKQMDKFHTLTDEFQKMQAEDPRQDVFAIPGTAGRVLGYIGIALGQGLAAMNGGPNQVLANINGVIDQNIAAQREKMAKAKGNIDIQNNVLGKLDAQLGDQRQADAAYRAMMLDSVATKAKSLALGPDGSVRAGIATKLQGVVEGISKERAKVSEDQAKLAADHVERTDKMTKPLVLGGGGGGMEPPKHVQEDAREYSKRLEASGIPSAASKLEDIDREIGDAKGSIKGVGPVADAIYAQSPLLYKSVYGDEAAAARGAFARHKNEVVHALSGAATGKDEMDRYMEGIRVVNDEASLRRFIGSTKQDLYYRQRNIEAGHGEKAVDLYKKRGGTVPTLQRDTRFTPKIERPE